MHQLTLTFFVILISFAIGSNACGRRKDRPERGQSPGGAGLPFAPEGWTLQSDWSDSLLKVKDL